MIYQLLKTLMTGALRLFYRHIYVDGLQHVPTSGPAIIIANHPSSLMDAALLGIVLKRPVYFFTRGDVFVNKWVHRILSYMHMIPVHDHEKGRYTLNSNNDGFNKGKEVLLNGGIIVFFPESSSHVQRQLLPFRKGVFRLAFQTMHASNFKIELPIVPIGITYEHPTKSNTCVFIKGAEPILMSEYVGLYKQNLSSTLLQLSKEAYARMRKLVLHINDAGSLALAETSLTVHRNNQLQQFFPWIISSGKNLEQEQKICEEINAAVLPKLQQLKQDITTYEQQLKKYRIKDATLSPLFNLYIYKYFLRIVLLPVLVAGYILNALPVFTARRIVQKKVYRIDFYSWLYVCISAVLYTTWWLLLTGVLLIFAKGVYAIILLPIMVISGCAVLYCKRTNCLQQHLLLKKISSEKIARLKIIRNRILQQNSITSSTAKFRF